MKNNLHSACLLFFVFLILILGFMSLARAEAPNYSFNEDAYTGEWGAPNPPESEYSIWGYTNTNYTFTINCPNSLLSDDATIVFYWDFKSDTSDYSFPIESRPEPGGNTSFKGNNTWDNNGTYYICAGVFQNGTPVSISYWVPINIMEKDITIEIQNFSMLDEREELGCNRVIKDYTVRNFPGFLKNNTNEKNATYYCAYAKNDYSFNATVYANCTKDESRQNFKDIITEVNWTDSSFKEYREFNQEPDNNTELNKNNQCWNESFTHEWDSAGKKEIEVKAYYWDLLKNDKIYSHINNTTNILIINDPKNFVSSDKPYISFIIEPFSNLQNLGVFLISMGLMILFFTYTKNNVPVKISILGFKPFYLKSVDTFIGIFIFVTGTYLYFIFGRCPWDIPIINGLGLNKLSNIYFNMLYYEYAIREWSIPCLSILLGLIVVSVLSLVIYRVGSQFLKGDLKTINILRGKGGYLSRLNTLRISLLLKRKQ